MADRLEGSSDILLYKLEHTKEVKESIRKAIETKGVRVSTDTPFREYADKIRLIQTNIVEPSLKGLVCHYRCHIPNDANKLSGATANFNADGTGWYNMVANAGTITLNKTYANYDESIKGIAIKNNTSSYAMTFPARGTITTYTLEFCFDPLNNFKSGSSTPILFRDYYNWYSNSYYRSRGLALYLDSSSNLILSTANSASRYYSSGSGYPAHNSSYWNKLSLGVIEPRKMYLCIRVNGNSFTVFNSQTSQTIKGSMTATKEFMYRTVNMMAYTTCNLHSVRLYNRVISDEEMYRNMNCDQVAYGF
jgi:hypothetical protein